MTVLLERRPSVALDVGQVRWTDFFSGGPRTYLTTGVRDIKLGNASNDTVYDEYYSFYVRFSNVTIPPGATINSAKLRVSAWLSHGSAVLSTLCFNAADNAVPPVSTSEYNALALTSGVAWDIVDQWQNNSVYRSPNLSADLQSIVDRAGWRSGNAVLLVGRARTNPRYSLRGFMGGRSGAASATLEIEYSPLYYAGDLTATVRMQDQMVAEVDVNITASVSARFDTPFGFPVPPGYRPWGGEDPVAVFAETVDAFTTADANRIGVMYGQGPTDHEGTLPGRFTTDDYMYAELPGETEIPDSGVVGESFTTHDAISVEASTGEMSEGMTVDDVITADAPQKSIREQFGTRADFSAIFDPAYVDISDDVTTDDLIESPAYGEMSEGMTQNDASSVARESSVRTSENVTTSDDIIASRGTSDTVAETQAIRDGIGLGWVKAVGSSAGIADAVTVNVGVPVIEVLTARDSAFSRWRGVEDITSALGVFGAAVIARIFDESVASTSEIGDSAAVLHRMVSAVTSDMAATDAVLSAAVLNPDLIETVAIAGLLSVLRDVSETVSDSAEMADAAGFAWHEDIVESGGVADAAAVRLLAIHILTSDLGVTDLSTAIVNFTDTITDTLGIASAAAVRQALRTHVTEILHFGVTVLLEGELWECWVLNTNHFHPSVYSGFNFNSYAVYNNAAYGCKPDGIYELSGSTDNGVNFHSGMVLPETALGSFRQKRFRKVYFGIAGSSPVVKLTNEAGTGKTYAVNSSRVTPTRGVKGRRWILSIGDFDALDFVELVPIILTR